MFWTTMKVYSLAVMRDFLERVRDRLVHYLHVVIWSDCGKHFRGRRTISTLGYRIVTEFWNALHQKYLGLKMKFGMPMHFKNECLGNRSTHLLYKIFFQYKTFFHYKIFSQYKIFSSRKYFSSTKQFSDIKYFSSIKYFSIIKYFSSIKYFPG